MPSLSVQPAGGLGPAAATVAVVVVWVETGTPYLLSEPVSARCGGLTRCRGGGGEGAEDRAVPCRAVPCRRGPDIQEATARGEGHGCVVSSSYSASGADVRRHGHCSRRLMAFVWYLIGLVGQEGWLLIIGVGTGGATGAMTPLTFRPKLFLKSFPPFLNTILYAENDSPGQGEHKSA